MEIKNNMAMQYFLWNNLPTKSMQMSLSFQNSVEWGRLFLQP